MNIEAIIMGYFREYDAKARALYPAYAETPVPNVTFFTKGRMNGWARCGSWEVQFNTHVAAQTPDEFRNTVSHEVAHMVDYALRGRSGHDKVWKMIHKSLGGNGARCSNYGAGVTMQRSRVKNEYKYQTALGAVCWVGPRHHGGLVRGTLSAVKDRNGVRYIRSDWTGEQRTIS